MSDVARSSLLPSYQEQLETALLDGASAIKSLTAERDQLRNRLDTQDRQLSTLMGTNEDLRRQIALIGESYVRFATSCVSELQCLEHAMQEVQVNGTGSADLSPPSRVGGL
jgi:predicted  nucleic acid-binding Zn-ribbon protein